MAVKYKDMAIRQKEILRKLKEEDFNEEELSLLKDVEDYIDKEITSKYNGGEIWIDLCIVKFQYSPVKRKHVNVNTIRAEKMYQEILNRYNAAGWSHKLHIDDGLEGNMSGSDYLILAGKAKRNN